MRKGDFRHFAGVAGLLRAQSRRVERKPWTVTPVAVSRMTLSSVVSATDSSTFGPRSLHGACNPFALRDASMASGREERDLPGPS